MSVEMSKIEEILQKHGLTYTILSDTANHLAQAESDLLDYFKSLVPERPDLSLATTEYAMGYSDGEYDTIDTINARIEGER